MRGRKVHKSSQRAVVVLDLQANEVRIGGAVLGEQWAELYAVLVDMAARSVEWVVADDLRGLGRWAYKTPVSIGKEVRRHVQDLVRRGARRVIESPPRGGTRRWRLAVPHAVKVRPGVGHLRGWIDRRRTVAAPRGMDVGFAGGLVRSSVSFQRGHMQEALDELRASAPQGTSSAWDAWHAHLLARVQARLLDATDDDAWEAVLAARDAWRLAGNALGKAMEARLSAILAYAQRFEDSAAALTALGRLAASLEQGGDLASLGLVTNMLGLLAQRHVSAAPAGEASLELLRAARAHFERAAGLFGLIGDAWALQAALFNAAHALCHELELQGRPPNDTVFSLLDLSLEVCERFHVGDDSLQAESSGADWAWAAGRNDLARRYCERALEHADIDNTFEQAILARILGRRAMFEGRLPEARQRLKTARRLFEEVGDRAFALEIDRTLAGLGAR
jgi:hypothetical protein